MQNWDIGRFLQQALPRELETLRLTGLDRVQAQGGILWRSHFVPMRPPSTALNSWEFTTDMAWRLLESPPKLSFMTFARINMHASSKPWLVRKVRKSNSKAKVPLELVEHSSGMLSLYASLTSLVDREEMELLTSPTPDRRAVERFAESYELASETLFREWKRGVRIGQSYRKMH